MVEAVLGVSNKLFTPFGHRDLSDDPAVDHQSEVTARNFLRTELSSEAY